MTIENQPTGRAIGGVASRAKLTPEQRSAAASKAAKAKIEQSKLPKATHFGTVKIGDIEIPCAVLENGTRVFSESGVTEAILGGRSGASKKLKKQAEEAGALLPVFIAPGQLKPFISKELESGPMQPVKYMANGRVSTGFDATILPAACEVWLNARQAGALQKQQLDKAQKAEILMRGLAHIGVIALVDEATGYQKDRARDDLAKILEAFVAKELQPWVKTFPNDYYEQLFRLYGIPFPPVGKPQWKPSFIGNITNDVVYARLAPDLLPELKKAASKAERKARLHQCLTQEVGHPKLREHLSSIVTLLKISTSPNQFKQLVNQVHPRFGDTIQLDFTEK
jgi:hypothetical protein